MHTNECPSFALASLLLQFHNKSSDEQTAKKTSNTFFIVLTFELAVANRLGRMMDNPLHPLQGH